MSTFLVDVLIEIDAENASNARLIADEIEANLKDDKLVRHVETTNIESRWNDKP